MVHEVEEVEDAASAAVAVMEGVDGFELIVADGEFDQGVNVVLAVEVLFPVAQQVANDGFACRRGVDDLSGELILDVGAGDFADVHEGALELAAEVNGGVAA